MNILKQLRPSWLRICCKSKVAYMSSSSSKLVDVSFNDQTGIATVTMQRAPVNGLNLELLQQMSSTFQQLEDDRKCRGMILTSNLPTVFCAGLDILELYNSEGDRQNKFWTTFQDVWLSLYGSSYTTVAAINGHSPAGGCLLSLCCEYRIMVGPHYKIGLNETQLGVVPPKWVMESMIRGISRRDAELALTNGSLFTTEEAQKIGLIDEIATDKEDAILKANKFLQSSKVSVKARKLTKFSMRMDIIDWLHQNREEDRKTFLGHINQPEQQKIIEQYLALLKNKKKT